MKAIFASLCIASALFGQLRSQSHPLGLAPHGGALGGGYTSPVISRPLGGVALPTFPTAPITRTGRKGYGGSYHGAVPNSGYRYIGPVYYLPNAFDTSFYNSDVDAPQPYGYAAPPQPIIVNQYFDTRRPEDQPPPPPQDAPSAVTRPGDPLSEPQNYYLIEYKDHTIYSALAYWIEGDTLHYVTTENRHNQASLSLIDLDKTYKLNEDRSVPFTIPGR
jgi:hypothetical protein